MMMPPPLKETRPVWEVVDAFLTMRGASQEDVFSAVQARPIVRVRHELMWLLRDLTHLSLADIGQAMRGRDATTVRHGIEQIADRIAQDDEYRRQMLSARDQILRKRAPVAPQLCLKAVQSVLTNSELSDAEARAAALQLMVAR